MLNYSCHLDISTAQDICVDKKNLNQYLANDVRFTWTEYCFEICLFLPFVLPHSTLFQCSSIFGCFFDAMLEFEFWTNSASLTSYFEFGVMEYFYLPLILFASYSCQLHLWNFVSLPCFILICFTLFQQSFFSAITSTNLCELVLSFVLFKCFLNFVPRPFFHLLCLLDFHSSNLVSVAMLCFLSVAFPPPICFCSILSWW